MKVSKEKAKKTLDVLLNVFLGIFLVFCIATIISVIVSKKAEDDAVTINGTQVRLVLTESMEECEYTDVSMYDIQDIPKDSMIGLEVVTDENKDEFYKSLEVGDVLTFKYYIGGRQMTITHRLIDKDPKQNGGYILTLRGDNINADGTTSSQIIDTSLDDTSFNYVIGKVKWVNHPLGEILTFFKSPVGMISVVIVPCCILMVCEIVKIVNVVNEDKKLSLKQKNDEIEELKKRLEQLEKKEEE